VSVTRRNTRDARTALYRTLFLAVVLAVPLAPGSCVVAAAEPRMYLLKRSTAVLWQRWPVSARGLTIC